MDHGVNVTQCLEYYKGKCGAELSEHYQAPCPYPHGYPCPADDGTGRWKSPDAQLTAAVAECDPEVGCED